MLLRVICPILILALIVLRQVVLLYNGLFQFLRVWEMRTSDYVLKGLGLLLVWTLYVQVIYIYLLVNK